MLLLCLSAGCCFLTGCSQSNYMGTDMAEPTNSARPDLDSIVAENKTYGLSLPNAEKFRDILKDFIYWEYAIGNVTIRTTMNWKVIFMRL